MHSKEGSRTNRNYRKDDGKRKKVEGEISKELKVQRGRGEGENGEGSRKTGRNNNKNQDGKKKSENV